MSPKTADVKVKVRATRAYLAGFGTSGSLLAGAALVFVLASAIVAFRGWPQVAAQNPVLNVDAPRVALAASTKAGRILDASLTRSLASTRGGGVTPSGARAGRPIAGGGRPGATRTGSSTGSSGGQGPTTTVASKSPGTCVLAACVSSPSSQPVQTLADTVTNAVSQTSSQVNSAVKNTTTTVANTLTTATTTATNLVNKVPGTVSTAANTLSTPTTTVGSVTIP